MELLFYAQPYDTSADGFFFKNAEDFDAQIENTKNSAGDPVEEFEIQFIEGAALDHELQRAWGLSQANIDAFIDAASSWDDDDKVRFTLAVGECGCGFDPNIVDPIDFDVGIYRMDSMRDLAVEFVERGLFGDVPDHLQNYIDFDAIARDLEVDYSEAVIAGERLIFRCI